MNEIVLYSSTMLLNALVLGFIAALVLVTYLAFRPKQESTAAQTPAKNEYVGNEHIQSGNVRPPHRDANRAA